jgi:Protein of unknown function (DUF2721)
MKAPSRLRSGFTRYVANQPPCGAHKPGLFWAIAALLTILLMIVAFVDAVFELPHETGVALWFTVALILFGFSLISFAREIRIAIMDPNNYD